MTARPCRTGPALRGRAASARPAAVTGTGAAASLALALLVLVCAFVAVAVPRASLGYRTQVLQRTFRAASSSATTVLADAGISGLSRSYPERGPAGAPPAASSPAGLRRDGLPLAPPGADWSGLATGSAPFSVAGQAPATTMAAPQLELLYRSGLGRNARLVAGLAARPRGAARPAPGRLQVAVTAATAARFGLRVGSRLRAAGPGRWWSPGSSGRARAGVLVLDRRPGRRRARS